MSIPDITLKEWSLEAVNAVLRQIIDMVRRIDERLSALE